MYASLSLSLSLSLALSFSPSVLPFFKQLTKFSQCRFHWSCATFMLRSQDSKWAKDWGLSRPKISKCSGLGGGWCPFARRIAGTNIEPANRNTRFAKRYISMACSLPHRQWVGLQWRIRLQSSSCHSPFQMPTKPKTQGRLHLRGWEPAAVPCSISIGFLCSPGRRSGKLEFSRTTDLGKGTGQEEQKQTRGSRI